MRTVGRDVGESGLGLCRRERDEDGQRRQRANQRASKDCFHKLVKLFHRAGLLDLVCFSWDEENVSNLSKRPVSPKAERLREAGRFTFARRLGRTEWVSGMAWAVGLPAK